MAEIILATMIVFGLGVYLGVDSAPKKIVQEKRNPDEWPPTSQIEMMKACSLVCGKNRVDTYDSLRGECKCIQNKGLTQ